MSVIGGKADVTGSKADVKFPMSAFCRFTSALFVGALDDETPF